jgi:NAD(P)-dependent dehydrogenase (short-subunit alcohol dehydrogenase family)
MSAAAVPSTVSLVTGGVRGLGLAVARALLQRGDRVHVVYRSSRDLARELEHDFPERVHRADALEAGALDSVVAAVRERDGRLDHLIHAVGEYLTGPLETCEPADLRRMFASNVESSFLAFRAARADLRASRGSAVFFGCAGLDGLRARRQTAAYTSAKSALLVLMRSLAVEEAPHGVRINMVSPGQVPHEHASSDTRDPELWERIPLGRPGTPEDVARTVVWLASPSSSYVTGADIDVAGGWML